MTVYTSVCKIVDQSFSDSFSSRVISDARQLDVQDDDDGNWLLRGFCDMNCYPVFSDYKKVSVRAIEHGYSRKKYFNLGLVI